jgi:hypothetical protein
MLVAMIEGANRVCGKSQGYLGLPIRDETIIDTATGDITNIMHTAWTPTPEELAKLNNGANVIISLIGLNPQPLMVTV